MLLTGFCGHVARGAHRFFNCFECAAFFLDAKGNHRFGSHCLNLFTQKFVPHRFAAKTNDDNAVDIGVTGKAGQNLLRHGGVGGNVRAAGVKNNIDGALDLASHNARGFAAAGAARQNQDMVADAGAAFRAAVAPELDAGFGANEFRKLFICFFNHLAFVIARDAANIVVINKLPHFHRAIHETDSFAVL